MTPRKGYSVTEETGNWYYTLEGGDRSGAFLDRESADAAGKAHVEREKENLDPDWVRREPATR